MYVIARAITFLCTALYTCIMFQPCTVVSSSELICKTPKAISLPGRRRRRATGEKTIYTVNFVMDGVTAVRNMTYGFPAVESSLDVFMDPYYETWPENNSKKFKGQNIVLNVSCHSSYVFSWL